MIDVAALLAISFTLFRICRLNFQNSYVYLNGSSMQRTKKMSSGIKKALMIKNEGRLRPLGLTFHVICTYPIFIISCFLQCLILLQLIKIVFNLHFSWFTGPFLVCSGLAIAVYDAIILIIFETIRRIKK